jgi:hypothetical protein
MRVLRVWLDPAYLAAQTVCVMPMCMFARGRCVVVVRIQRDVLQWPAVWASGFFNADARQKEVAGERKRAKVAHAQTYICA